MDTIVKIMQDTQNTVCCIANGYYWCVVDRHWFFLLFSFLPDCVMNCRFSNTLSVTIYLCILCLVRRHGVVTPSVYLAGRVWRNVWRVAALCWSWLESAEPLRTNECLNKVGRLYC
jgi:hypothetical protein